MRRMRRSRVALAIRGSRRRDRRGPGGRPGGRRAGAVGWANRGRPVWARWNAPRPEPASWSEAVPSYLRTMRDDVVALALCDGSDALADLLKAAIKQHGSGKLTSVTLRMVEQASTLAAAVPDVGHPVHLWFRPLIAERLNGEG